jgi:hypothetical protein
VTNNLIGISCLRGDVATVHRHDLLSVLPKNGRTTSPAFADVPLETAG